MKTAQVTTFLGVLACGLLAGRTPLHAQPTPTSSPSTTQPSMKAPRTSAPTASSPIAVEGGEDKPWSRGVPIATRQAARNLFLEGNRLFKIPIFARAAEKYLAALRMWKHPAFYFNLALAQLNLGQEVEAHDSLERALNYGGEPLGAGQYEEAQKQLQEVERQLGRIRVTCSTTGAEVTLDGATLFTGPGSYEGWVTAKDHELTAKKLNYLPQARRVTVSPAKLQTVDLRLVTLSEAADTSRRWAAWKPWAVVATGAAAAAAGSAFHALSFRNFNSYDSSFSRLDCAKKPTGCTNEDIGSKLNAQLRLATREQKIAVGGYIVGGSVIAAGVMLLYLNRTHLAEQEAISSPGVNVSVVPAVSADMLGIQVAVSH